MPFDENALSGVIYPACNTCKHYARNLEGPPRCKAFPTGIPDVILEGDPHIKPVRGDHGIRFETAD